MPALGLASQPTDSNLDMTQFELESQTGFLVFSDNLSYSSDKRELQLKVQLARGVERSLTTLVERLALRSRSIGVTSELSVAIEPSISVGLRPQNLRLRFDGKSFSGTALMMGRQERLASFKSGRLESPGRELVGEVAVFGRSTTAIQVKIDFHVDLGVLKDLNEIRNCLILDQDGANVCKVDRLTFLGIKGQE